MQNVFLGCFLFGALFTVVSLVLGLAGAGMHQLHIGDGGDLAAAHPGSGGDAGAGHGDGGVGGHHGAHGDQADTAHQGLPVFNLSSVLAFLTWFGAAGYLLMRFAAWPALPAAAAGMAGGGAGAVLIGLFLANALAGERVMDPREYRLEGTIARVSVSIPAGGTGEVVFTKAGSRRGEAARSLGGKPIARDSEVVIVEYERGVAAVPPWDEFLGRMQPDPVDETGPHPGSFRSPPLSR